LTSTLGDALYEFAIRGERLDIYALADFLEEAGELEQANELRGSSPTISLPITETVKMKFAWVPPGESWLGGGKWVLNDETRVEPQPGDNQFTLKKGLWCGIYPVTQAEWQAAMGDNHSYFADNPTHPVERVSWNDVQEFLKKVNQAKPNSDLVFRLPTEEEWEYICRGGPITKEESKYDFYFATSKTDLTPVRSNDLSSEQANFDGRHPTFYGQRGSFLATTSPVGSYTPNPLGIYDMHGNVWEWTSTEVRDEDGSSRVFCGGSWFILGRYCSAAERFWGDSGFRFDLGFRLIAEIKT
jgi:formylglycine-generating enzyme required for sulfatase activity